jgi:hypothetical protein
MDSAWRNCPPTKHILALTRVGIKMVIRLEIYLKGRVPSENSDRPS